METNFLNALAEIANWIVRHPANSQDFFGGRIRQDTLGPSITWDAETNRTIVMHTPTVSLFWHLPLNDDKCS